jgi:hypothetical protein
LTWALVGLCVLLGGLLAPSLIWLHGETQEGKHLRDRLDEEMKLGAQYRSERDVEVAAHAVTKDLLEKEQHLRAVVEMERNESMRKARAYLARSLAHASEGEIDAAVSDLFSSLPGVVRPQVPTASSTATDDTALEKP